MTRIKPPSLAGTGGPLSPAYQGEEMMYPDSQSSLKPPQAARGRGVVVSSSSQ